MSYADEPKTVVDNLSTLIAKEMIALRNEQHFPVSDVDRSESDMAESKRKIAVLRELREQFEAIMTGALL